MLPEQWTMSSSRSIPRSCDPRSSGRPGSPAAPGGRGAHVHRRLLPLLRRHHGRLNPTLAFSAGDHYGSEIDAGVEHRFVKLDKNLMAGGRVAYYRDDKLKPSQIPVGAANRRTSTYTMYAF